MREALGCPWSATSGFAPCGEAGAAARSRNWPWAKLKPDITAVAAAVIVLIAQRRVLVRGMRSLFMF